MDKTQITDDQLRQDRLKGTEWRPLSKQLMYFTHNRLRKHFILSKSTWNLDDLTIEIVRTAITKVILGERKWDPIKYPDLYDYLSRSVIPSLLFNFFKNHAYRSEESFSEATDDEESSSRKEESKIYFNRDETAYLCPQTPPDPFDQVAGDELYTRIRKAAQKEGDWESELVLDCLKENIKKRADISEQTGIDAEKITNIRKRIQRLAARLIEMEQEEIRGQVSREEGQK